MIHKIRNYTKIKSWLAYILAIQETEDTEKKPKFIQQGKKSPIIIHFNKN